jgi:D-alanyl-D-alanine carboxypeptidase (penicillin-binding protein 5/6)
MNIVLTLITIFVFPLNLVWFSPEKILSDSGKEIPAGVEQAPDGGQVQGTEKVKEEKIFEKIYPAPLRLDTAEDLALPNAHSSIILDVESGTILHYNNGKERRPIASLTKLMTAILVLEKVENLDEEVTVDADAVYIDGTRIGCPRSGYCPTQRLKVGEKITVISLLKAMLMNSANDAALALAKHVGGNEEKFVDDMNRKAKELELMDTHFCTASGLDIDGRENECYSSAYDVARIASYSMKYDLIWEILRMPSKITVTSADGTCSHEIINTDLVLNQVSNCLGGKTGFTPAAGHSLLLAVSDDEKKHKIVAVVLDDPYRWQDIKKMVDWSFESYEWK